MNTYHETLNWLYSRLPMFQRVGQKAFKKDLTNINSLCAGLGNPQKKIKSIHIAGTNGKGSTAHMLASILQEAGYTVGLITSPHLKDFRERIKVNREPCPKEFVVDFVEKNKALIENQNASFFEVTTAMGFQYLAEQEVDIAVIETGLGGEFDSTNIITPILSVITNIGKDHTNILGSTYQEIAKAKAGIIKPKIPVVIGERKPETEPVFKEKAKVTKSEIYFSDEFDAHLYESDLKGIYQNQNQKTVLAAIQLLNGEFLIEGHHIQQGLQKVVKNTGLRGRWEILNQTPFTVCDTGHNIDGVKQIVKQIQSYQYEKLHLVLGFVQDKDVMEILNLFPQNAAFYFCTPNVPRGLALSKLKKIVPKELKSTYFNTVKEAFKTAKENAQFNDFIFVGGSTFVVAEIID